MFQRRLLTATSRTSAETSSPTSKLPMRKVGKKLVEGRDSHWNYPLAEGSRSRASQDYVKRTCTIPSCDSRVPELKITSRLQLRAESAAFLQREADNQPNKKPKKDGKPGASSAAIVKNVKKVGLCVLVTLCCRQSKS